MFNQIKHSNRNNSERQTFYNISEKTDILLHYFNHFHQKIRTKNIHRPKKPKITEKLINKFRKPQTKTHCCSGEIVGVGESSALTYSMYVVSPLLYAANPFGNNKFDFWSITSVSVMITNVCGCSFVIVGDRGVVNQPHWSLLVG